MNFVSIRMITADVRRLVDFYAQVLDIPPRWATEDFAELRTPAGTLAIAAERTLALFGTDVARAADNHSVIIEFRVEDVDTDYQRLIGIIEEFVQTPTTMPWGNRSLLFRDPDGNLVNLFTPVTADAVNRQQR
jgi:catechol 2,3-dioxygenase-like lactoylglutathione lyase family enzyme